MIQGRCECARVKYEVRGDLVDFSHCHCSICRRLHGAAFATFGGVKRDEFVVTSGQNELQKYAFTANSDSIFCTHCGSRLWVQSKPEPDMLWIALGTVLGDLECPAGAHYFVESKASWFEVTDDLPQYIEDSDELIGGVPVD